MGKGSGSGKGAIVNNKNNDEVSIVTASSDVTLKQTQQQSHLPADTTAMSMADTAIESSSTTATATTAAAAAHPGTPSKPVVPTRPQKPRGLQNIGNSCYANAALQCLLNTALSNALLHPESAAIFRRYSSNPNLLEIGCTGSVAGYDSDDDDFAILSHEQKREIRRREKQRRKTQETSRWLTRELTLITKLYTASAVPAERSSSFFMPSFLGGSSAANSSVINPGAVTRYPHRVSTCLRPYQQEDAHEFIRALLSTLTMNGHNKQLSSLFDGLLESAVTCQHCDNVSITRDRYMDLSLDISHESVDTLQDALELFTETEILDGDNKVTCRACRQKRVVSKGLRLATAPSVLVCHLKRFAYDNYGRMVRLSKKLSFPLRLDLGDYMSRANKAAPPPYELVSVLVHQGRSCDHGHYLAYVKSGQKWYKANDDVVTETDQETVLQQPAYLLMYEVAGMRARHDDPSSSARSLQRKMQQRAHGKDPLSSSTSGRIHYGSTVTTTPRPRTVSIPDGPSGVNNNNNTGSFLSALCSASEVSDSILRDFCCGVVPEHSSSHTYRSTYAPDDETMATRRTLDDSTASQTSRHVYILQGDDSQHKHHPHHTIINNTDNNTVTDDTVTDETVHTADSSKFSTESQRLRKSSSSSNLRQLEHEASRAYLLDDSRRPRQRGLSHKERPVTSGGSVRHRTEGLSNRYDATATKKKSRRSQSARAPRLAASASPRPPHLRQGRVPSRRGIGGNEPSPPRMEL